LSDDFVSKTWPRAELDHSSHWFAANKPIFWCQQKRQPKNNNYRHLSLKMPVVEFYRHEAGLASEFLLARFLGAYPDTAHGARLCEPQHSECKVMWELFPTLVLQARCCGSVDPRSDSAFPLLGAMCGCARFFLEAG
jgi:hypothetical protein